MRGHGGWDQWDSMVDAYGAIWNHGTPEKKLAKPDGFHHISGIERARLVAFPLPLKTRMAI